MARLWVMSIFQFCFGWIRKEDVAVHSSARLNHYFLFPFPTPGRDASPLPRRRPDPPAPPLPLPKPQSRRRRHRVGCCSVGHQCSMWRSRGVVMRAPRPHQAGWREAGRQQPPGKAVGEGMARRGDGGAPDTDRTGRWVGGPSPSRPRRRPERLSPVPLGSRFPLVPRRRPGLPCW